MYSFIPEDIRILFLAREFAAKHTAWIEADEFTPVPSASYWTALESLTDAFGDQVQSRTIRAILGDAILRLNREVDIFDSGNDMDPSQSFVSAANGIGEALRHLDNYLTHELKVETLVQLDRIDGLSDAQKARMLQLFDARGEPDISAIAQEREKPGSVITDKWCFPPEQARRNAKKSYELATEVLMRPVEPETVQETIKPAVRESLQELFDLPTRVEPEQAAKITGMPLDKVKAEYARMEQEKARQEKSEILKARSSPAFVKNAEPDPATIFDLPIGDEDVFEPKEYQGVTDEELRAMCKEQRISASPASKRETMIRKLEAAKSNA